MIVHLLSDAGAPADWDLSVPVLLVKATVILVAALTITLTMRRASAGARHLVWLVTLGALLLVPALTAWSPLRLEVLPAAGGAPEAAAARAATVQAAATLGNELPPSPIRSDRSGGSSVAPLPAETSAAPGSVADRGLALLAGVGAGSILTAIWAFVGLAIAGSLAYSALVVRRIVREARPLDTQDWLAPLWEVSDRLGLDEPPRLLRSGETKMPFACGVVHPTIVLPAECDGWTLDRRRAVLLHELAHVRRHDLVGHTLGRLACAVYWFHPLVWTAAKRLRSESERACDDLALTCGARATDYAEHLLEIVTSVRRDATPSVALAMARRKEFEGRMLAILDPELRHSSPGRRQAAALIASLAVISVLVGAAAPAPRTNRDVAVDGARAGRSASVSELVGEDRPAAAAVEAEPLLDRRETDVATTTAAKTETQKGATQSRPAAPTQDAEWADADTESATETAGTAALQRAIEVESTQSARDTADDRPALLARVLQRDTSATLRRIAAWGLAQYAETQVATDALASALRRDADAGVREMAAWALADGDDGSAVAIEALSAALRRDANVRVRTIAAWSLGHLGDRGSVDVLAAALSDASPEVRSRAAWALGHVEPTKAPPALLGMLRDREPQVRKLAAWALFNIEDPGSIPALESALRAETNKELQLAYIRALAAVGEHSVDAIRGLLESPDPAIKSMAVRALAGGSGTGPWPWPWPEPRPSP